MVLQDSTLAPTNQAVQPQDFLKTHERRFLEEQSRFERQAVKEGLVAQFGRVLTADEVRAQVTQEMVSGWT